MKENQKSFRHLFVTIAAAKHPDDKTRLQRHSPVAIAGRATGPHATDREIHRLVYDLYGLTEEEIALVEGQA